MINFWNIFIQVIGIIAMVINILSYQLKTAKQIIFAVSIAALLFSINMYFLGAYTGSLINLLAIFRGIFIVKVKNPPKWTFYIFLTLILGIYAMTFAVFGKTPSLTYFLIELLPTSAMIVQTYSYYKNDADKIRFLSYYVSPCWLIYNIINFSIGGILCEAFALVSITISLIRSYYTKKRANTNI